MEALETIKKLRKGLQMRQSQLAADIKKMVGLELTVIDLGGECERLLKADLKKEEELSSMTSRVTELKTLLQERKRMLYGVTIERNKLRSRNEELSATCQQMEERLLQQSATSQDATNKLQQMLSVMEVKYETLEEDYEDVVSRFDNLATELSSERQQNSALSVKLNAEKNVAELLKAVSDEWQAKHQQLQLKFEMEHNEWQEKNKNLKDLVESLNASGSDLWVQLSDNAKLSYHQNHLQKTRDQHIRLGKVVNDESLRRLESYRQETEISFTDNGMEITTTLTLPDNLKRQLESASRRLPRPMHSITIEVDKPPSVKSLMKGWRRLAVETIIRMKSASAQQGSSSGKGSS